MDGETTTHHPIPTRRRAFESTPSAVRAARHFVDESIPDDAGTRADVALAVSEMAANAVMHARSPFTVAVSERPGLLRVEVADQDLAAPRQVATAVERSSTGRGLQIVGMVAVAWGSHRTDEGKVVWAEFERGSVAS